MSKPPPPYTQEQIEYFKAAGRRGGRPPKVACTGQRGCRCANCRRARGEYGARLDLPKSKGLQQTAARVLDVEVEKSN